MKKLLLGACALGMTLAMAKPAEAVTILTFTQNGTTATITGTAGATSTTITGTSIPITIGGMENVVGITAAFLTLNATSTGTATLGGTTGNDVIQRYTGTFTITSGAGGTGTNYLSGSFTDSVFGAQAGTGLTLQSAQPPDTVTFTSSVITSLGLPRNISLAFTNVMPVVAICGTTICSFTASVAGNFSAATTQNVVPEPGSMVLLGAGLIGLAAAVRRRRLS